MQRMRRRHDRQRVLPSDEGSGTEVRVLQVFGKVVHVHFAVLVARYGNAAPVVEQWCVEQLVFA